MLETPAVREPFSTQSSDGEGTIPQYYDPDRRRRTLTDTIKSPLFVAFTIAFILIFVLYIWVGVSIAKLQKKIDNTNSGSGGPTGLPLASSAAQFLANSAVGSAVSYLSPGLLQSGAGTTLYRKVANLNTSFTKYLELNSVFHDVYVYSAVSHFNAGCEFYVYKMNGQTPKLMNSQFEPQYNFSSIVTLNAATGLMVGLAQDYSGLPGEASILAMRVNPVTYAITFGEPGLYSNDGYALGSLLASVSNSSFALVYYHDVLALTRYGEVDSVTLKITMTSPVKFANNSAYNIQATVAGLGQSTYLVAYYDTNMASMIFSSLVTVANAGSVNPVILNVSKPYEFPGSAAALEIGITRIDDYTAVIAYVDKTTDFGVTALLVHITSEYVASSNFSFYDDAENALVNYVVQYASRYPITTGRTQSNSQYGQSLLRVGSYTSDSQFAVLFTDVGNNGDLTLAVCQVTASAGITRTTPNLLITEYSSVSAAGTNASLNLAYQWGAFAVGSRHTNNGQMMLASVISDQITSVPRPVSLAIFETRARPTGVVQSNNQITITGTVTLTSASLKVGAVYYALTNGSLLQSSTPLGSNPVTTGYSSSTVYVSPRLQEYVEEGNIAVLLDSRVGVAVTTSSLLLLPVA